MKVLSWLNKRISYTRSWRQTIIIGLTMAALLVFVLVFLEPFDTYYFEAPNKNLLLAGYGPFIFFPVLLVHIFTGWVYRTQAQKWFVWNEVIFVSLTIFLMMSGSYLYNYLYVNRLPLSVSTWWSFMRGIGLPFVVFLAPFFVYLRSRFGLIEKQHSGVRLKEVTITGQNKKESLSLPVDNFVYAQSQQNYAVIFYKTPDQDLGKKMLRITLAQLNDQIPSAVQVHRSYLVNLNYLKEMKGNARKRHMELEWVQTPIPVSQKYYKNIKTQLSDSSQ